MGSIWISQFYESFIKNYTEESDKGFFFEDDVPYPAKLREPYNDLPFLPERIKIEKVKKRITMLLNKTEYVIHIKN